MVGNNSTRLSSSKKQHEKFLAILINYMDTFFRKRGIKSVAFISKQSQKVHIRTFQYIKYISIAFL